MTFQERLITLRKQQGLSQEQLGYELGVTRQTVSKWELGVTTPEMDKLIQLSDFFHISIDELVGHTSPEPASKAPETDYAQTAGKFTMFLTIGTMNTRADSRSSDSRWSTSMWEDGFPGRSSAAPGECLPSEMQRPG